MAVAAAAGRIVVEIALNTHESDHDVGHRLLPQIHIASIGQRKKSPGLAPFIAGTNPASCIDAGASFK
ncbi:MULTISPECIES: hypothetical protein [unclassified Pseudomonas]|uniref:hypothetical protein n=1 Tax=unclassified Pseudomonas TaxID=196821 RepID=UPI002B2288B1|nr:MULTISPECIES: hypothetical protein [unclassified Pseudomonas]MEB0046741.1 hypothetical protein [Pseudomonas sp. Dout3]MEB0097651.1 hypothetical protein [Pseudomonas sp. DC1.2]